MSDKKYGISVIAVNNSRGVTLDKNCNAVTFLNTGTTLVRVNGVPLHPGTPGTNNGESFSIPGNYDEVLATRIDVVFPTGAGALTIIQKYYLG